MKRIFGYVLVVMFLGIVHLLSQSFGGERTRDRKIT